MIGESFRSPGFAAGLALAPGRDGLVGNAVDALVTARRRHQGQASFLRTTPAKKPRTECCCQPVAFMTAAMVAPLGPCNMAITLACFDPAHVAARAGFR